MKTSYIILGVVLVLSFAFVAITFVHMQTKESASEIIAKCAKARSRQDCYVSRTTAVVERDGPSAALDLLASVYKADPRFSGNCHFVAHAIGQAAYEVFHEKGSVELNDKMSYCGYGFYHGFMQALFSQTHDFDEARRFCHYAGAVVPLPVGYAEGACYHGIGHGVTDGYDSSLWGSAEKMATPGLSLCHDVATSTEWQYRCSSGVFNSIATLAKEPKYGLELHGDPFALCATKNFTDVERRACYDQMNTIAGGKTGGDLKHAIEFANRIEEERYRAIAIHGIASYYVQDLQKDFRKLDIAVVSSACSSLPRVLQEECIRGIVDGIGEFGTPETQYPEIRSVCSSAQLSRDLQEWCYSEAVKLSNVSYIREPVSTICRDMPERFRVKICSP